MPRWVTHAAFLATAWLIVVSAAALLLPHELDWWLFTQINAQHSPVFSAQISIVDVAWNSEDLAVNRRRIAKMLDAMVAARQHPKAVILDFEFDACQSIPCGEPMQSARLQLSSSIQAAASRFPIFAVEQPQIDRQDEVIGPSSAHDELIYGALSGSGHTRFTALPNNQGAFFRACYSHVPYRDTRAGLSGSVWSLVDRVLLPEAIQGGAACDTSHIPLYLGAATTARGRAVFKANDAAIRNMPDLNDKYVIVGTIEHDRSVFADRSGPELLGWALSNALDLRLPASIRTSYEAHPQNGMLLIIVPAFSALSVICFGAMFGTLKKARLGRARYALPWLSSIFAGTLALGAFIALEAWMLHSRLIQPQVSLVAFATMLAAGCCGLRGYQSILDDQNSIDVVPGETFDYDVFISYAHEDGAWVYEHVYSAFRDATLSDGTKMSVFFDTTTIRGGTAWQEAIALSIDASRFIVPVYSETYFKKPYCRFEIRRAHRKWIGAGEESRCVLPIMRGHPPIDKTVDDIQAVSIDDQPDIVDQYVREVLQRLSNLRGHRGS